MGSGIPCPELGGGPLVAVVSWNQVGRTDLTPVMLFESVLLMPSRRKLWYIGGNHPSRDEYDNVLDCIGPVHQ